MAGNGTYENDDAPAIDGRLYGAYIITVLPTTGELAIALIIRKIDRNGIITTVAGNGLVGFGGDGGSALNALLSNAGGIIVTDTGDVLFADISNNRIRKEFSYGTIVTIAGNGNTDFSGDGVLATDTALNQPQSVAYMNGEVYITDTDNHRISHYPSNKD